MCITVPALGSVSAVNPGNNVKKFVWSAGGTREHEKPVRSHYGRLCKVVSPKKRAQRLEREMLATGNLFGL